MTWDVPATGWTEVAFAGMRGPRGGERVGNGAGLKSLMSARCLFDVKRRCQDGHRTESPAPGAAGT